MACYLMKPQLSPQQLAAKDNALKVLARKLANKEVTVFISRQGALAFQGWSEADRGGLADTCAYRALAASNSPELRRAVAAAEARYGLKLDKRVLAAGVHSHDGGKTFHNGH